MMRSMFAAISGLKVHQTMLDVTSNDIANVNTLGFKGQRTTFKDSLAQLQRGGSAPTAAQGGSNAAQVGLGVQLNSIDNQMQSGALQTTGNVLDVAIQGEGWFRVAGTPTGGNLQYSRAGNFTRNANGDLVTQDGFFVQGSATAGGAGPYGPINIANGATNVAIGPDGAGSYDPAGGGARPGRRGPLRPGRRRRARHRGLHHAREVPERGRPRADLEQPLARQRGL